VIYPPFLQLIWLKSRKGNYQYKYKDASTNDRVACSVFGCFKIIGQPPLSRKKNCITVRSVVKF
jgi:hypothetical protein